jgi:cytochrome b
MINKPATSTLIWDLPTRLFHWLITAGFSAAALIAFLLDDGSRWFPYHAIIGLVLGFMVLLRLVWGFAGTKHARFGSFVYSPAALVGYLKRAVLGGGARYPARNPGSAYASLAMLALLLGISGTGILLSLGHRQFKEAHEVMSYAMIAVVGAHVLGVILHTIRHRENVTLSMVTGRKDCEASHAIASARPIVAAILLALAGLWTLGLTRNYDAAARSTKIPVIGTSLSLSEGGEHGENRGRREREHDDD